MDNISSVDTVQMAIVLYAIRKSQQIDTDVSMSLVKKIIDKLQENQKESNKTLEKELYPWLGQSINELV